MQLFLSGAYMMGALVIGIFFLKFWTKTKDRLFLVFAVSFWMMAFERFFLLTTEGQSEVKTWAYVIRLVAFILIIAGVVDKNKRSLASHISSE